MNVFFRLLTQLSSRRTLSCLAGRLAKSRLSRGLIPLFVKAYGIDVSEAQWPPAQYPHLNAFFTRRLKEGARPIDPDPASVISPVDGKVTALGAISPEARLAVKGEIYTVADLLKDEATSRRFEGGHFIVIYLSPRDYHRIHAPASGQVIKSVRIRGKVYPVHPRSMALLRGVLAKNERLISYLETERGQIALVKVGAMNVASIRWSDRFTSRQVTKGDELAYFEFGSTVVLLFERNTFRFIPGLKAGDAVKMGQPVGYLF